MRCASLLPARAALSPVDVCEAETTEKRCPPLASDCWLCNVLCRCQRQATVRSLTEKLFLALDGPPTWMGSRPLAVVAKLINRTGRLGDEFFGHRDRKPPQEPLERDL